MLGNSKDLVHNKPEIALNVRGREPEAMHDQILAFLRQPEGLELASMIRGKPSYTCISMQHLLRKRRNLLCGYRALLFGFGPFPCESMCFVQMMRTVVRGSSAHGAHVYRHRNQDYGYIAGLGICDPQSHRCAVVQGRCTSVDDTALRKPLKLYIHRHGAKHLQCQSDDR